MGRSVSYPTGSFQRIYVELDQHDWTCGSCRGEFYEQDEAYDENGDKVCPDCGASIDEHAMYRDHAEDFALQLEELRAALCKAYPSMTECDEWIGREDHALVENRYAYIGISEYCGTVCIWAVPRTDRDALEESFGAKWCESIRKSLRKAVAYVYGEKAMMDRVATMNNGDSVYQRAVKTVDIHTT